MKTAQPITELCKRFEYPYQFDKDAFQEALQRKEETALYMGQLLNEMLHPDLLFWRDPLMTVHYYALILLTELRETRAHRTILRLLGTVSVFVDYTWGGLLPDDFARALAATCDGDYSGIAMLIRQEDVHIYVRRAAVDALVRLVADERIQRTDAIICLTDQLPKIDPNSPELLEQIAAAVEMLSATNLTGDHSRLIGELRAFYNSEKPADHENRDWWNPLRRPRTLSPK